MKMNKPDTSKIDYKYGVFHIISRGRDSGRKYWTDSDIRMWCDKNDVYYESTDKREDLIERIKKAGYR